MSCVVRQGRAVGKNSEPFKGKREIKKMTQTESTVSNNFIVAYLHMSTPETDVSTAVFIMVLLKVQFLSTI